MAQESSSCVFLSLKIIIPVFLHPRYLHLVRWKDSPSELESHSRFLIYYVEGRGMLGENICRDPGVKGWGTMGSLPFLNSVALRLQRGHGQWEGSIGVEVPRRVQSHLFHWSIYNLVPLATLFLEPASPPFWEIEILGSEVTIVRKTYKMQGHLRKSKISR